MVSTQRVSRQQVKEVNTKVVALNSTATKDAEEGAAQTAVRMTAVRTDLTVLAVVDATTMMTVSVTMKTNSRRRINQQTVLESSPKVVTIWIVLKVTVAVQTEVDTGEISRQVRTAHPRQAVAVRDVVTVNIG